jgi:predicted acylesterase/phospholipase RssA
VVGNKTVIILSVNFQITRMKGIKASFKNAAIHKASRRRTKGQSPAVNQREEPVLRSNGNIDLILSSGFLAFAAHCGFLQAVEDTGLRPRVKGLGGTSSGALTGCLWASGYTAKEVAKELKSPLPIQRIAVSQQPWQGLFSLQPVVETLRLLLPVQKFELLQIDMAAAVVDSTGHHRLIDSGPIAEAVVASASVPILFQRVDIPGQSAGGPFFDGGVADRVGLNLWRQQKGDSNGRLPVVHLVGRSSPFSGRDDHGSYRGARVVFSEKSRASLFNMGEFDVQFEQTRVRAMPTLVEIAKQLEMREAANV